MNRKQKLRAINQSVMAQVKSMMADEARVIQRSQVLKAGTRVFGKADTPRAAEIVDGEQYVDDALYTQMLRDFVTASGPAARAVASRSVSGAKKMKRTKKKNVDTRASKGRKLRYTVMDKLVSFAAPVDLPPPPMNVDGLFASLFS